MTLDPIRHWVNLALPRLGAEVIFASDDFFAPKERLIQPQAPVFIADKYDDHGKWMDGWESRRKRTPGHDHCVVRLGLRGIVHAIDIDTRHFIGNYPPAASVDGYHGDQDPGPGSEWSPLVLKSPLQGDVEHRFEVADPRTWSHVRLNIYPDGGVARLRVYGEVNADWPSRDWSQPADLVAVENGGRAILCNDEHFGAMQNLLLPGRGVNMGDGWETRRRREPGHDWVILQLGHAGRVVSAEVDTAHFKGNYPDRVSMQAIRLDANRAEGLDIASSAWPELLPQQKLAMDQVHCYAEQLRDLGVVTHVRVNIYPDGGLSRVRLSGYPAD